EVEEAARIDEIGRAPRVRGEGRERLQRHRLLVGMDVGRAQRRDAQRRPHDQGSDEQQARHTAVYRRVRGTRKRGCGHSGTACESAAVRARLGTPLLLGVVYVVAAVWWTWPLAARPGVGYVFPVQPVPAINRADALLVTWMMAWSGHALVTSPLHVFDANIW